MIDPTTLHTDDAPQNWERYAKILHEQPGPALAQERAADMLSAVHTSIATGSRKRAWASRWVMIPAASAITIVLVLLLISISTPEHAPVQKAGVPVVTKENNEPPRQVRRQNRNRLPEPWIPDTPFPAVVDSALLPKPGPIPPLMDPIGPGGARQPRAGTYRSGSASGHSPTTTGP